MVLILPLIYIALVVGGIVGWVINLITVVHLFIASAPIDTMFIGLGVPVVALGAILGWF